MVKAAGGAKVGGGPKPGGGGPKPSGGGGGVKGSAGAKGGNAQGQGGAAKGNGANKGAQGKAAAKGNNNDKGGAAKGAAAKDGATQSQGNAGNAASTAPQTPAPNPAAATAKAAEALRQTNLSNQQVNEIVNSFNTVVSQMVKAMGTPEQIGAAIDTGANALKNVNGGLSGNAGQAGLAQQLAHGLQPVFGQASNGFAQTISNSLASRFPNGAEGVMQNLQTQSRENPGANLARMGPALTQASPLIGQMVSPEMGNFSQAVGNLMTTSGNALQNPQGGPNTGQISIPITPQTAFSFNTLSRISFASDTIPDIGLPQGLAKSDAMAGMSRFVNQAAGPDRVLDGRDVGPIIQGGLDVFTEERPFLGNRAQGNGLIGRVVDRRVIPQAVGQINTAFQGMGIPTMNNPLNVQGTRNFDSFNQVQSMEGLGNELRALGNKFGAGGPNSPFKITFPNGIPAQGSPLVPQGALGNVIQGNLPIGAVITFDP